MSHNSPYALNLIYSYGLYMNDTGVGCGSSGEPKRDTEWVGDDSTTSSDTDTDTEGSK